MIVRHWMKTEVITVASDETVAAAKKMMEKHRIRRLPVVENEALIGIVSPHDLEKVMPSILDAAGNSEEQQFIADTTDMRTVMTPSPITIGPGDTLFEAARKMRRHRIDGLPVVENRNLVGILSISDILDAFLEIMAVDRQGTTRFDLKIDHSPESFYRLIKPFQKRNKEILAISQFHNYSREYQLLTVQTSGDDDDELVEMLWAAGVTVDRVTHVS